MTLHKIIQIILITSITAILIIIYGVYRCKNPDFHDPLGIHFTTKSKMLNNMLNGWAISHFMYYTILTYLYPEYWMLIFVIGCIWEIYEMFLQSNQPWYVKYIGNCTVTTDSSTKPWWYGQFEDIIMNTLGISFGKIICAIV